MLVHVLRIYHDARSKKN